MVMLCVVCWCGMWVVDGGVGVNAVGLFYGWDIGTYDVTIDRLYVVGSCVRLTWLCGVMLNGDVLLVVLLCVLVWCCVC